jgi:hypothetical protein
VEITLIGLGLVKMLESKQERIIERKKRPTQLWIVVSAIFEIGESHV